MQAGSDANLTRVNAIKDFELEKIIEAVDYFVKQNDKEFLKVLDILNGKFRSDLYEKIANYLIRLAKI